MKATLLGLILAAAPLFLGDGQTSKYAEGQVWEYKTRVGDQGSLLKIQKIETDPAGRPIFHISVIGFHLAQKNFVSILPHEPVSQRSLDLSVTRLHRGPVAFPSATDGIAEWRRAHGGVSTISIADTIDVLDKTLHGQSPN